MADFSKEGPAAVTEELLDAALLALLEDAVPTAANVAYKLGITPQLCEHVLRKLRRRGHVQLTMSVLVDPEIQQQLLALFRERSHNFLLKQCWLYANGCLPAYGLSFLRTAHDGWCNFLEGRGCCNCDPFISLNGEFLETPTVAELLQWVDSPESEVVR